jgi:hypothetical protein
MDRMRASTTRNNGFAARFSILADWSRGETRGSTGKSVVSPAMHATEGALPIPLKITRTASNEGGPLGHRPPCEIQDMKWSSIRQV